MKTALLLPTSGGRSVGIVGLQIKATKLIVIINLKIRNYFLTIEISSDMMIILFVYLLLN
jgi:hypothetical protein